jgi:prepilin-type N-terminal cleavage/methylation domain-containing protein
MREPEKISRRSRAFTAVEVLIAMTIMAIGAAAVISMQRVSVQGNLDARETDMANTIARTWVERLQHDATLWTQPGPSNLTGNNLARALVISDAIGHPNNWRQPTQYYASDGLSCAFDILGRDVANDGNAVFCASVRMNWLTATQDLIRADVRVLWSRGILTKPIGGPCLAGVSTNNTPDPTVFHAIYLTTAIKGNPQ